MKRLLMIIGMLVMCIGAGPATRPSAEDGAYRITVTKYLEGTATYIGKDGKRYSTNHQGVMVKLSIQNTSDKPIKWRSWSSTSRTPKIKAAWAVIDGRRKVQDDSGTNDLADITPDGMIGPGEVATDALLFLTGTAPDELMLTLPAQSGASKAIEISIKRSDVDR